MLDVRLNRPAFALVDRDGIFTHIEEITPARRSRSTNGLSLRRCHLIDFPESGRPGRVAGTRELVVTGIGEVAWTEFVDDLERKKAISVSSKDVW